MIRTQIAVAMLVGGIYALVTARVPSFLTGGGKYRVEGTMARWFGVMFLLPAPAIFIGSVLLALLFEEETIPHASTVETVIVLAIAILAAVLARFVGTEFEPIYEIDATIAKKAQRALTFGILSTTGWPALVCCPLAFINAGQALKLIDKHNTGEQHRGEAKAGRAMAAVGALLLILGALCLFLAILIGTL